MLEKLKGLLSKERLRKLLLFISNPRLLLCLGIAWMIAVGGAYLTFLWLPISPEKIVTVAIAILLLRLFFPKDTRTLAVLQSAYRTMVAALIKQRQDKRIKREKRRAVKKGIPYEHAQDESIEDTTPNEDNETT